MQRHVFVPTHFHLKNDANKNRKEESFKVLEVAGGTGRLMTFFRDNYPQMDATFLELSPYYIEEARKNDETFRRYFKRSDPRANNIDMKPLKLVQGRAEKMKFEDESFDIINCVYLFHEIPPEVRKECAKEFLRVLRPGGIVAFNDSIQATDREGITSEGLSNFPKRYHEPYYNSYIEEDINAIFLEAGFEPGPCDPIIANRSKVLSWVKPGVFTVPNDMMKAESWGPEEKKDTTAAAEIKAKFETSRENRKEYMKTRAEKIKNKMNKNTEEAQKKVETEVEEFKEKIVDPVAEKVQEAQEVVTSAETKPEEKLEKVL